MFFCLAIFYYYWLLVTSSGFLTSLGQSFFSPLPLLGRTDLVNNLEKWEPYALCSLFPPQKAYTKQKQPTARNRQQRQRKATTKKVHHTGRVGNLPGVYQASPSPNTPGRGKGARSSLSPPLSAGTPGGPGAAAHAAMPPLPAPTAAPRSGGSEEVIKGVHWGSRKIIRARRDRLSWDGYTKSEGEFAGVEG